MARGTAWAFLLFFAACSRPESRPAAPPALDLSALAFAADFDGPLEAWILTAPCAARLGVEGVVPPLEPRDEPYVWLRPTAELRLGGPPGAARRIVLDLEPHPNSGALVMIAYWNGRKAGRAALDRQRRLYVIDAPRTGGGRDNRLRLRFLGAARQVDVYRGRLSVRAFAVWAGPPGEASLGPARVAASERPFAVRARDGSPEVIMAPGVLRFALHAPEASELRFGARLLAGADASLRVVTEGRPGAEHELWRGGPGADEVAVPLAGGWGQHARLSLRVEAADLGTRVAWTSPRLVGSGQDAAPSHGETDEARADGLRATLTGANVLLVVLDSAGARHLGPWGGRPEASPEITRLASESVVFENAFTPAVYTIAAMSSLFSSLAPDEHGNLDPWTGHLSRAPLVVSEVAGARGVHTAGFVANGMVGRIRGFDRGFAEFHELYTGPEDTPRAAEFRPLLERFLAEAGQRRFFAWVHYLEPHFPYDPEPPFDTLFGDGPLPRDLRREVELLLAINHRRRRAVPEEVDHLRRLYLGSLAYADREIGHLRRRLDETGLLEKTVLIVTADHGEAFREHGHIGHEVQVYDELAHVPLLIRFPKAAGLAGRRIRSLVELNDLAPTIADALGFWRAGRPKLQGLSLLPVAAGAPGRRSVVTRERGEAPRYALRDEDTTCILDTRTGAVELYDRRGDPAESRDLATADPLRADVCRQALRAWIIGRRLRSGPARISAPSAEDRERLRALGYVQ
ncbi:MAG TPA: sulfatase [Vicinamibacteria bacterium]|nr:sulfatase [Vicinamibacteria bacterium]